jgi:hypothetical protein
MSHDFMEAGNAIAAPVAQNNAHVPFSMCFGGGNKERISGRTGEVNFGSLAQANAAGFQKHMMVGRRYADAAWQDQRAILGERYRRGRVSAQQLRQGAWIGPMCITTKTAAVHGTGSAVMMRRRGSRPPAEAAMTKISSTVRCQHRCELPCNTSPPRMARIATLNLPRPSCARRLATFGILRIFWLRYR